MVQEMLLTGGAEMAQKYFSTIQQHTFYQGAPRAARLLSYQLIKQMSSFFKVDWSEILGIVIQDALSADNECMINAYQTIMIMPYTGKHLSLG